MMDRSDLKRKWREEAAHFADLRDGGLLEQPRVNFIHVMITTIEALVLCVVITLAVIGAKNLIGINTCAISIGQPGETP